MERIITSLITLLFGIPNNRVFLFSVVFPPLTHILYAYNTSFIISHLPLMMKFIKPFLIFVVMYHLFVTIIGYGLFNWIYPQLPALSRDVFWGLFFVIIAIYNFKTIKTYLNTWKRPRITFIVILIFGTCISLLKGKSIYDIFVGIKYWLLYLFIFLSATFIGFLRHTKESRVVNFLKFLKYLLITTLIVWFFRQGLKFIWPDIFLHIGYGPLHDFKFWVKPPIYYLTWYQGTARRQWIFSWPNNYGYFLIAFLPAILFFCKQKFKHIQQVCTITMTSAINIIIIILWIFAILLTLSRTAFIGWIVGLTIINMQRIQRHKKLSWGIWAILLLWVIGLSILKWSSTLGHIQAKFGSIQYVIQQPSGYWLWTSWPAVNHNGTILPENYYLQLMLDIGTIGFILRTILIFQITQLAKKIQKAFPADNSKKETIYIIRKWLSIWRVSLLVMWIFLHVFEDSMVNYVFFIARGILSGYLSTYIKKTS